jgi:hypothetical protein
MHTFTLTDAHILLGLSAADKGVEILCSELIAACAEVNNSIPTLAEFAAAFNKFLFVSAINLQGEKITFANFGREIIKSARSKVSTNQHRDELLHSVLKELSGYKLKRICNRSVWTQAYYEQAINAQRNHLLL